MARRSEAMLITTACVAILMAVGFAGMFAFLAAAQLADSIGSKVHSVRLAVVAFSIGATVCVLALGLNLCWLLRRWRRERSLKEIAKAELAAAIERSSQTLSSVAATCHEMRTPVHAILGFADLLGRSRLDAVQSFHVETLRRSAEHLLDIVEDGLTGPAHFAPRPARKVVVDLDALLGETHAITAALCASGGGRIHTSRDPQLPRHIAGDVVQIRQVLLNLAGNAVKYAPTGRIDISASRDSLGDEALLRFDVLDEGPGLSDDAQRSLFTDARSGATDMARSSGLGLVISKTVVLSMGGAIGFEPRRLTGSHFWFTIPLVIAPDAPAAAAGPALGILVADDSPSSLAVMSEMLRHRGHFVTAVASGDWAVRAAATLRYDLIFLDIQMAGGGGIEAAEQIRRLPAPHNSATIYALSGMTDAATRNACLAAGMNGCLPKPLLPAALDKLLASWSPTTFAEGDIA